MCRDSPRWLATCLWLGYEACGVEGLREAGYIELSSGGYTLQRGAGRRGYGISGQWFWHEMRRLSDGAMNRPRVQQQWPAASVLARLGQLPVDSLALSHFLAVAACFIAWGAFVG